MEDEFFNFNPAPDYGSILGASYDPVNTSYDRREELEKQNDAVREKNAELPFEIAKKLAGLIPTAKKLSDKFAWDKYNKDSAKENPWKKGTEEYEEYQRIQEFLDQAEKINKKMQGEAYEKGDIPSLKNLKSDGIGQRTTRNIVFNADKITWDGDLARKINENFKGGIFPDADTANNFVNGWWEQKKANLIATGFNNKYIEFYGRKKFDDLKANFLQTVTPNILKQELQKDKNEDYANIEGLSKSENFNENIYKWADTNKGKFGNNLGNAVRYKANLMIEMVEADKLSYELGKGFLLSITQGKGDKEKLVVEKLGGSTAADMQVYGWLQKLEQAENKALGAITTRDNNYHTKYEQNFRNDLYKDGNVPTKQEIVDYIYNNEESKFDFTTGGLPQGILKSLSQEAQDDAKLIPSYEKKAQLGILTVAEVMKLESSDLRNKYLPRAISVNNMGMTQSIVSRSKEAVKTMADEVEKASIGKVDKSSKWLSIKQQGELLYPSLYAANLKVAALSPEQKAKGFTLEDAAHAETMKQLYERAYAGQFDTWGEFTTNTLKMQSAVEYLAMDKDHINTQIIPGYEEAVKQAMNLPDGSTTTLTAFKQLGDKIGVPGWQIQLQQKKVAEKLGGVEHIKSEVELAFEKLPVDQKKLLSKYTTQAKLARAKFLAFMEDSGEGEGVITWTELSTLHPDVAKFIYKEETGQDMPETPQLGKFELRKGEWKELPGATRIGYAVWDGKDWVYSSTKGRGQESIVTPTDYKDRDGYFRPFEGKSNDLTTTFIGRDEPLNFAEEGGPRAGDWYKTTNKNLNAMNLGDIRGLKGQPFVVWNGKEWVPSAVKGRFPEEYQGPQPLSTIQEEEALIKKQANMN